MSTTINYNQLTIVTTARTSKTKQAKKTTMEQRLLKVAKSFGISKMRTSGTIKAEAVYYGAQDLLGNAISLEMYRKNKNGNGNGNGNGNKFDWNEWKEIFPKVLGFTLDRLASMSPEQQERAVKAIASLVSKYIYMGQKDPVDFIVEHNEKKREELNAQKIRKIFIDDDEDEEIDFDEDFDDDDDDEDDLDESEENDDDEDDPDDDDAGDDDDDDDDEEFSEEDLSD